MTNSKFCIYILACLLSFYSSWAPASGNSGFQGRFKSPDLPSTLLQYLPAGTQLRVTDDLVIPAFANDVEFADGKIKLTLCGKKEPINVEATLKVYPKNHQRVITAGSILSLSSVEQRVIEDRYSDPDKFIWYRIEINSVDIRYMALKVSSGRWSWFGRWGKVRSCAPDEGFTSADLENISGGYFQVFNIPESSTVGQPGSGRPVAAPPVPISAPSVPIVPNRVQPPVQPRQPTPPRTFSPSPSSNIQLLEPEFEPAQSAPRPFTLPKNPPNSSSNDAGSKREKETKKSTERIKLQVPSRKGLSDLDSRW
jgi:hypothetical protein